MGKMEENSLNILRETIEKLKKSKKQIEMEVGRDRAKLEVIKSQSERVQNNYDVSINKLSEKKDLLDSYQTMIDESQTAYSKLMDNTNKLIATLDIESQGIKSRFSNTRNNL